MDSIDLHAATGLSSNTSLSARSASSRVIASIDDQCFSNNRKQHYVRRNYRNFSQLQSPIYAARRSNIKFICSKAESWDSMLRREAY
jgi:hypothetical protein